MKIIIIFIIVFVHSISIFSQNSLDTIYANDAKTVSLFFPKPIRQGIVGKSHFVFSYNQESHQYFGLLQATPGKDSNLLAITSNGHVYSYILKYAENLSKLNYFITEQESIGNEKPRHEVQNTDKSDSVKMDSILPNQSTLYKEACASLMMNPKRKVKRSKIKNRIKLSVTDITYNDNAIYFLMEIENKSIIDYDVNFLRFFITDKLSTRKKSSQTLLKKPVYIHLLPGKIKGNSKSDFVVVFSKFTIGNDKKIMIELNEMIGERDVKLKISEQLINYPKKLNSY